MVWCGPERKKKLEYLLGCALEYTLLSYNSKECGFYYGLLPPLKLFWLSLDIILMNNMNSNNINCLLYVFLTYATLSSNEV